MPMTSLPRAIAVAPGAVAFERLLDVRAAEQLADSLIAQDGDPSRPYSPVTGRRELIEGFSCSQTLSAGGREQRCVREAVHTALPEIEVAFGLRLELIADLRFLSYGPGGFISPHCDLVDGPDVPAEIRERRVVFSLLINGPDGPGGHRYGGGEFELYPDPPQRMAITAPAGTLVAFDARMVHAVAAVTEGTRLTAVGWLRAASPAA
jgi:hypothetical protein